VFIENGRVRAKAESPRTSPKAAVEGESDADAVGCDSALRDWIARVSILVFS